MDTIEERERKMSSDLRILEQKYKRKPNLTKECDFYWPNGFEEGNFSAWTLTQKGTGCELEVQSDIKFSGNYACRYYSYLSRSAQAIKFITVPFFAKQITLRAKVLIQDWSNIPSGSYRAITPSLKGPPWGGGIWFSHCGLGITPGPPPTFALKAYKDQWITTSKQVIKNLWYDVIIKIYYGNTGIGHTELYIDGALKASAYFNVDHPYEDDFQLWTLSWDLYGNYRWNLWGCIDQIEFCALEEWEK